MLSYRAPIADTLYALREAAGVARLRVLPRFAEASDETIAEIVTAAARLAETAFQPLNRIGDVEGCRRTADGTVTTPPGFSDAYRAYADGGWVGLSVPAERGGQGLPHALTTVMNELVSSANMALAMFAGLTQGAIAALLTHGSAEQQALFLPPLVTGRWTGTMNLTEPQCGTDLGLIRTQADPAGDGSYRLSGTKIFISAGEHDLAENIVHLVLARIDGAPAGVHGLSLFLVPKIVPDADGRLGARNAVTCTSLERKMGIHGNPTCTMVYDGATGWLVGEAHKGVRAMFTMMNEARLAVGVQGLALSEVAAQSAAAYARERRQGRVVGAPADPHAAADPIIVHADVRRALMTMRAFNESARALVLWIAVEADLARHGESPGERRRAADLVGLLTPVIKGVLTDRGFENTVMAQQVFGGAGYIAEVGVEQFVRDARIAMIYEGTNGIQALDLLGRKLPADGGRAMMAFLAAAAAAAATDDPDLAALLAPLAAGVGHLKRAVGWLMANALARPEEGTAAATDLMHLVGLVALGLMWARMAKASSARLAAEAAASVESDDPAFHAAKLVTARFFMTRIMPESALRLARIEAGSATTMALPADAL